MQLNRTIYLDHAATTPPLPCALDAFRNALFSAFGNPSSAHAFGHRARAALNQARTEIAECINAEPEEIYFTAGATEACNWAIRSMIESGYYVTASQYEHHAVIAAIENAEMNNRYPLATAQMLVNNETGELFNVPESGKSSPVFTDATAAVGHIPVDVKKLKVDYLAAGAHKFGGLPGIGFLYARTGTPLSTLLYGGGQERGSRAGTESVALAAAMSAALKYQCTHLADNTAHFKRCARSMLNELGKIQGATLNSPDGSIPYILNVSFPGVDAGVLALMLSVRHVMVSPGAACTSGENAPSHVLMSMFRDEGRARSAIRISFGVDTTPEECHYAGEAIGKCVEELKAIS